MRVLTVSLSLTFHLHSWHSPVQFDISTHLSVACHKLCCLFQAELVSLWMIGPITVWPCHYCWCLWSAKNGWEMTPVMWWTSISNCKCKVSPHLISTALKLLRLPSSSAATGRVFSNVKTATAVSVWQAGSHLADLLYALKFEYDCECDTILNLILRFIIYLWICI